MHGGSIEYIEAVRSGDESVADAISTKGGVNKGNWKKSHQVRL